MHRLLTLVLVLALLQTPTESAEEPGSCRGRASCGACLAANPNCAWCSSQEYSFSRCDRRYVLERFCAADDIVSPQSEFSEVSPEPADGGQTQPVQITPQHVRLRLRPHEVSKFEVQFQQVEDYPLDLYYLMDLTYSQWDDKTMLEELGEAMATTLKELTANFRVGFGSFVDKPVMPYVSMLLGDLDNPCRSQGRLCVPPYGFKNHLNLTNDMYLFAQKVRAAGVSANIDDPEGGLDALVQAVVCGDVLGWNKKSRKLLIYSSNGLFHLAGEGLLGGAAKKNDLQCHLNSEGYYTASTVQDYPSVEELDNLLRKESVNVVFAVTKKYKKVYERLVSVMKASARVEETTEDSSNILTVIKKQYESITSQIELQDDAPEGISVRYFSQCLDGEDRERSVCTDLRVGDKVQFQVQLEVMGNSTLKKRTIYLKDVRSSESVRVDLEVLNHCDCEAADQVQTNSSQCSRVGDLACGVCVCPDNRPGRSCECTGQEESSGCRPDGALSGPVCSDRGDCVCGQCQCRNTGDTDRLIDGPFCECDNYVCDRARDGTICGGERRGVCDCGECVCQPGWSGSDCSCNNDTRNCAPPGQTSDVVCSGKGDCVCGRCVCYNTDQGRYAGLFCEDCPTCRGLCRTYQPCALCLLRSRGAVNATCQQDCPYVMTLTDQLGPAEKGTICRFEDEKDSCFYSFQYYSDSNGNAIVDVHRRKECSEVDVLGIVLGTVGGVLAIGLLTLLLWRIYTSLMDRREYAKFQADLDAAVDNNLQNTNQLYQSPVTTYRVPEHLMATFQDQ